jgi:hypothetical protein
MNEASSPSAKTFVRRWATLLRDQNQCKHKSTRSSIASNHLAGMMQTGNAAFMRI